MCGRRPHYKKNLTFGSRSGASHVSACSRGTMTAGPDVVRDRVQITSTGFDAHDPETGCPNRRLDRFASHHHHPRNSIALLRRRLTLPLPSLFRRQQQAPALCASHQPTAPGR
jgi:hypothetical protein